ncbi:MAG: hypothetical protein JW704_04515 [Anaerolineaceae bacterium]|nr:hypothetical protein [Anaerolineaceae bacterium]MBN2678224.1 hypothetical protein [Anaerolineaceae bacterium]
MKSIKPVSADLTKFFASGKVRIVILIITIVMFILAAGAPGAMGGIGN